MFDLLELQKLLSAGGQKEIINLIEKAKSERGAGWLAEFKSQHPELCWAIDLIANKTADEAYKIVCERYPLARLYEYQLKTLHNKLRAEIDKPR